MSWHRVTICVLLLAVFSGCTKAPVSDERALPATTSSVKVPNLFMGDSWVEKSTFHFQGHDEPEVYITSANISAEREFILDAYGRWVPGYVWKEEVRNGSSGRLEATRQYTIEAARGIFVAHGDSIYPGRTMSLSTGMVIVDHACSYPFSDARVPIFMQSPLDYRHGTAMGLTLTQGGSYEQRAQFKIIDVEVDSAVHFRALERVQVEFMGEVVEAIWVEREATSSVNGQPPASVVSRLLYGHAIPIPLATEIETPKVTVRTQLEGFWTGSAPFEFKASLENAVLDGLHPSAVLAGIEWAPSHDTLGLSFPLDEAYSALNTSVGTLPWRVWMLKSPEAYILSADYMRDETNKTYTWSFVFADGTELMLVKATRKLLAEEPPVAVDTAETIYPLPAPSPADPLPSSVRAKPMVSLGIGLRVAEPFLLQDEKWDMLGFNLEDRGSIQSPNLTYTFWAGPAAKESKRIHPLFTGSQEAVGPVILVDLQLGRTLPSARMHLACLITIDPGVA
jgi:hypothetical protein